MPHSVRIFEPWSVTNYARRRAAEEVAAADAAKTELERFAHHVRATAFKEIAATATVRKSSRYRLPAQLTDMATLFLCAAIFGVLVVIALSCP